MVLYPNKLPESERVCSGICIVRFQKSLKLMQNQTENISQTQIAYQCGYSDQSHFIREFRELSRYTPLSLIKICEPYSDLFTTPI